MKTATKKNATAIKLDLLRRGEFFHGGDAVHVAWEWAELFSASDAAAWMDVGVWCASTAGELETMGYSPRKIKEISDAQTDAGIEYSSGNLIYALCNLDAGPDDIKVLESAV